MTAKSCPSGAPDNDAQALTGRDARNDDHVGTKVRVRLLGEFQHQAGHAVDAGVAAGDDADACGLGRPVPPPSPRRAVSWASGKARHSLPAAKSSIQTK